EKRGFALGIIFSGAMVALMCLYILYETSTLMLHASEDDDVVVAIALFSSLMTLFFYILRIFMASRD
ncbi:MAG: permease, partial [Thermoguttaceae bacterium]|nr:permease [Thermoguttaceae bacterium]